jgi:nicotinamide mononucleotide adenylyltransferase
MRHIDATDDIDGLAVVLGSTQYDHTRKSPVATWASNPFTAGERTEMLESALAGQLRKPWSITLVPDFHDWPKWHAHLVATTPAFEVLYTSDAEEAAFFSARGTEVRGFPRPRRFHAGTVRTWIATGAPWRHAVPEAAAVVLDRIGAAARLAELFARDATETR